jgi:alpha-1,3-rhamnosyl/mannosyltransferase
MRVAFDARALEVPALAERGIGRYAACLLDALRGTGLDVAALGGLRRPPAPERVRELWEHVLLARDVREAGAGVLHSPSPDFTTLRPGVPYVVTVHDLAPLKRPDRYLRTGLKHRLRYAAARRATRVIVPSRAVARDCEAMLGIAAERIAVVPEAAAPVFRPRPGAREALARLSLPDRFVLWAGGLDPPDPRKGLDPLAALVARGDGPPLVRAGRTGPEAAALAAPGRVLLAGRVDDDELAALYSAAEALVFPSEDEGFGLPPVEALACGTPVAAFASPALQETLAGNGAARLVPPGDYEALLAAAAALAGTRAEPPARTWGDVARETIAVYEDALSGRASTWTENGSPSSSTGSNPAVRSIARSDERENPHHHGS